MRAARLGLLVLIAVATASQVAAAQTEVTALERFQLFNNCEPMFLVVENLDSGELEIGLTEQRLQAAAESRLRGARLYTSTRGPYLYVNINTFSVAFSVKLEYNKLLFDAASGSAYPATTWEVGSTGTHGRNAEYIVSVLSGLLDQFLTEYLRVNEAACER